MMTVEEILSHPKVDDLVKNNQHIKKRVERAAEILKDVEPDPVAALLEAARALLDRKITVFLVISI